MNTDILSPAGLYDHKFDIDDIITALCMDGFDGRLLLNTREGFLAADSRENPNYAHIQAGDDANHWFVISPLPFTAFREEAKAHPALKRLNEEEQTRLFTFLENARCMDDFIAFFNSSVAGGWLRERVKEAALEWLDMEDLIPPSMKHVYDPNQFAAPPARASIRFEEEV